MNTNPKPLHVAGFPQSGRVSVPLAHWYGPCAPLQTKDELSLAQRLHRDRVRTKYITRRMSRSTRQQSSDASTVSVPTRLGSSYDSQEYLVTVGLGTPAVPQTLVLTTESDLTWVQCKPCNSSNCYPQKLPLFDPSRSSTYNTIPVTHRSAGTWLLASMIMAAPAATWNAHSISPMAAAPTRPVCTAATR